MELGKFLLNEFQEKAGGGVSFLRDFNGLAQKPIRQKGNAEPKKMRRPRRAPAISNSEKAQRHAKIRMLITPCAIMET